MACTHVSAGACPFSTIARCYACSSFAPTDLRSVLPVVRLITWLKITLLGDVTNVEKTNRLVDSPAIIGDHDSAVTRRMMQMEEFKALGIHQPSGHKLMINPSHPLIIELHRVRFQHPGVAKIVAEQILDNAKISAGIVDHVQSMMPRLSAILKSALSDGSVPVIASGP